MTTRYALGDRVYAVIHPELMGIITGILFRPTGYHYAVTWASDMNEKFHFECELTDEKSYGTTEVGSPA